MKRFLNEKPVEKFCLLGLASFAFATAVQIGCSNQAYDAGTSEDGVNEAYGYSYRPMREPPIVIVEDAGSSADASTPVLVDAGSPPRVDAGSGSLGDGGLDRVPGTGGRGTSSDDDDSEEPSTSKKKSSSSGSSASEGESEPTTSTPKKKASSGMACNASPNGAGSSGFAALLAATLLFVRRRSNKIAK